MTLAQALAVRPGDLVALVGSGGKSSLLFALARAWYGPVLLTTTTRLGREQTESAPACLTLADIDQLGDRLARRRVCLVVAGFDGGKALGVAPDWPDRWHARAEAGLVVVEADGARRRPIKAPADHEPVIPTRTTLVVVCAGLDGLEGAVGEVAHRPNLVHALTGRPVDATLTPADLARLLSHPAGGLRGVPDGARIAVCLNKADTPTRRRRATLVARRLLEHPRIERVLVTSLHPVVRLHAVYAR